MQKEKRREESERKTLTQELLGIFPLSISSTIFVSMCFKCEANDGYQLIL